MDAGRLDRRITIQHRTVTRDPDYGSEVSTWSTLATVWAGLDHRGGQEFDRSQREIAARYATFLIRYRSDVTGDMRITEPDGSTWEIVYVRELKKKEGLALDVVEFANA